MKPAFAPADQETREEIRLRVDENMCVEAGAGTGKTTVLVDRIVHLLATTDTDVRRIAVITFTEKAAAELAARVRCGLEEASAGTTDDSTRNRLAAALRGLNQAHIETIHAFASSLLRERPIEAGLDPGFEVLDVLPSQLAFETQYREWLHAEMANDPPPAALIAALDFDLKFDLVRQAAQHLHGNRDMLPLREYARVEIDADAVIREITPLFEALFGYRGCDVLESDRAYQDLLRMTEWFEDTRYRSETAALRRAIVTVKPPVRNAGNMNNWRVDGECRAVKRALDQIRIALEDARTAMREAALADLLQWLVGFVRQYEQYRRDNGKADFDDLLIWARDLVRDNAGVRAYFQSKYARIFVDEFQDTDPLQVELVVSLCAAALPADWRHAALRPGSLFVVGDPKQSIYRFRRADIAMYDEVKSHVFDGEPKRIVQNFRSETGIIDWVNRIFAQLFQEERSVQPPYIDLEPRPDFTAELPVTLLRGAPPAPSGKNATIEDARKLEAQKLAALIRASVRDASWRVRTDGGDRAASYRDIVVLIPSRAGLELYEDAFARAELPFRHEGGRTFFVRQEVRELIAVLRAIDDPGDAVAAVAALRSAAFGCSDEDLLLHKHGGGYWEHTGVRQDAVGPVPDALRTLHALAELRYTDTLPVLVRAVLERTRLVEFAMLQPQGDQVAANLLKIIDQARTFAEASGRGLRGFVRWLKENMERTSDETDAPISEETDDVVRIITVHASKGLEFPIVVLANLATERRDYTTVIADREQQRLHVKLGKKEDGFRTPGFSDAEAGEERHSLAEEQRLLYVAATRAKDRLVVSLIARRDDKTPSAPTSLGDWLRTAGAHLDAAIDLGTLEDPAGELPIWRGAIGTDAPAADVARVDAERERWIAGNAGLVGAGNAPLVVQTASALKPESDAASAFAIDAVRRGRAAEFGTAVHALLERTAMGADRIEALADAVAAEFGVRGRAHEMAAVARRAIDSPVARRALASTRVLLEAPFSIALPGNAGLAEGRIDLLFEEGGELVIVDFKTDAVSAADVDARVTSYRNQALVYGWAARNATGMPVREVVFLFARPEPAIERSFAVDPALLVEAEALFARALAAVRG